MAPSRKRYRGNDDDEDVHGSQNATSSFRPNAKRSRVAMAQERGGSTVSDDESDGDVERMMNGTDDEEEDDQSMAQAQEDEEEEIDEHTASQFIQRGMNERKENVASEYGVIEEVRCRNFMCHGNLRIKLGPLINFIIGHNGSGKSAVLTALTMCLGGKATATNRATSMKSLIKEGQESATLAVKIKNRGDGAYKPDLYGTSILVERHFSKSGSSGFKIKNAEEKIISTKKGDLDDILDYFAFQLDNPINVLTQDMARQFLSNSTPEDKYKFFIKGTQLETLDADYKLMEEHLDGLEAKLRSRRSDIGDLKQKAEQAEKRKKRLDASTGIQQNISRTQWMHAWAQVEEQERMLETYERDVLLQQQQIEETTDRASDATGTYDGHNQAFEAATNHLDSLKANIDEVQARWTEEKAAFDANTKDLMDQRAQERLVKDGLKASKANKRRLEEEISEEENRLSGAEGPAQAERLQRLEELRGAVMEVEQKIQDHLTQKAALMAAKDEAAGNLHAARRPIEEASSVLERSSGLVTRLQRDQGNKFAPFRPNMANLVRAVNSETRWRKKPVGPMGLHVKLLKQEWSSVIEKTFGGVLDSFVCTNKEDQTLLSQIMKRIGCPVQIYIGPDRPLDTTGKEPDEGLDTILRVLEIDNHMVRNQLIINQAIDQTVLIPNNNEASEFMYRGPRPRNAKVAVAFGAARGSGLRYEFSRSGQPKSGPISPWDGAPRMQTDREEQIRRAKQNEDDNRRELDALQRGSRDLQAAVKLAEQAIFRWDRQNKALRLEKQKADDAVEAKQGEIELNRPQDGRLQELQSQLESLNQDINSAQNTYQDGVDLKDRLNEKATGPDGLKARADTALREYQTAKIQIEKAEDRKAKLERDCQNSLRAKNLAIAEIDAAKHRLQEMEERRDNQQSIVKDQFVAEAEKICQRIEVEPGVTTDILDKRLEKFEAELARVTSEAGGTREELTMAWRKAADEHRKAKNDLKGLEDTAKVRHLTESEILVTFH
jgi:chromosome segregation ATPase